MTYQYDAFISYRHHAVDSAVAAEIQHRLEHFRIPRAIQKATGVRKISRIFRDKAELAITSDINEDILNALEHSAFLIVICSTHTAESLWVQREIEIFLRTHTRRQVLTVLVDGEPIDVIPQTLCWQEETVTDADGTERVQRVPVEPLSCDYRAGRRQAHREELPRLAAALIGCPYDALRQRQRQYQMRRLAAGFSAALLLLAALAAYFLWSSLRIRENYDQALRSQSAYLASESQNCLAGGDRLTAIHLALAALPSEEQDRPLVAQAEYALSRAAGAYVAPGGSGIEAVCSFQHKAAVRQFFIDDAGERLFVLDGSNTVTIWDKHTYEKIHTKSFPDAVDRILLTGGDLLIAAAGKWIAAYDCTSGENVWLITEEGSGWLESEEICLTPDGGTLLVVRRDYENAVSQNVMVHINAETGAVERETLLMNAPGEGASAKKICFSADGRYAAFYDLWLNENNSSVYYAAVYDIARGELTCLPQTYNYIEALCFTQNGDLIVQGMTQDLTSGSERYGNFTIVRTSQTEVFCVDPQSGALRWQNSYDVTNLTIYSAVETLRYPDASGTVHDAVACTDADAGAIFDAETGELLWETKLPAPAVYMDADDESVYWILEDGQTADYTFGSDYVGCLSYFQSGLTAVAANHGIVTQKGRSSELILYYSDVYDEGWRTFEGAEQHPYFHAMSQSGSYLLLYDQNNVLELLDVAGERSCWQLSLAGERYEYTMLGFTADEQEILLYRETYDDAEQPMKVLHIAVADGSVTTEPFTEPETAFVKTEMQICGDRLVYALDGLEQDSMCIAETDGTIVQAIPLDPAWNVGNAFALSPDGTQALIHATEDQMALVDFAAETVVPLGGTGDGDRYKIRAAWSPDGGRVAYLGASGAVVCDADGTLLCEIAIEAVTPVAVRFAGVETLLVVTSDSVLSRYAVADGSLLGQTQLSYASVNDAVWAEADENTLVFLSGQTASVIRTDEWMMCATVDACVGYYPQHDKFVVQCYSGGIYTYGLFSRYTTQELIEKGEALLGGMEMPAERKMEYGLAAE